MEHKTNPDFLLGDLLKRVSRSFYLTMRVLPKAQRVPISLAYLLARAADTIADTPLVPSPRRLELLLSFREQVNGPMREETLREIENALTQQQTNSHERELLQMLTPAVGLLSELTEADRAKVCEVVTTLTRGMEMDLTRFPPENAGKLDALQNAAELDRYIYLVAGCVGEFWTKLNVAHVPALRHWNVEAMSACGIRYGKALQMTNVLRDCPKDLRIGRCYMPREILSECGLTPEDLLKPENTSRARPMLGKLMRVTLGHYEEAERYIVAIPRHCVRLRLACMWPVLIGLATLRELAANPRWLDPACPSVISQRKCNGILALSLPAAASNAAIRAWMRRGRQSVIEAIGH
ncbi:MAG TPA: phytoene/squalene synthase family protein [Planctomycetota bacterium]|jgi:farnesyl-diphosphate farnesyltransferase